MNQGRWEFDAVANMSTTNVPQNPKMRFTISGGDSILSVLADADEIGGLLSRSDSLEYVLLRLLCISGWRLHSVGIG